MERSEDMETILLRQETVTWMIFTCFCEVLCDDVAVGWWRLLCSRFLQPFTDECFFFSFFLKYNLNSHM